MISPCTSFLTRLVVCVALSGLALPSPAKAENGRNGAAALGALGGFAAGAMIAGAMQPRVYVAPPPRRVTVYEEEAPSCYMVRRRFVDEWGTTMVRREQICE